MFVDRRAEIAFLDALLTRTRPTAAQLVLLYGRRRIGKTVLVRTWAEAAGVPHTYWVAERETAPLQRRKLFARALGVPTTEAATFDSWADLWTALANIWGDRQHILILDEITYAAASDPAFLSSLQHAWDGRFKESQLVIVLSGSHVHTMETLLARGSPLFGRFTGQWHLQPLGFETLREFLPKWSLEERLAAYAIVGGVPAYLEWLKPEKSLSRNLRDVILSPGSIFLAEPQLLLYDELRDPRVHLTILQAIGAGAHTHSEIANAALVGTSHLSAYLNRLQELRLVERRLPVTVPARARGRSRKGRYHIADAYLRFYYRFIAPHREDVGYRPERVLPGIQEQLRAFVGATAFEELCMDWVRRASRAEELPFVFDDVGSHWDRGVQVDVVGVNWTEKAVLAGEAKWGAGRVDRGTLRELVENKLPKLLAALPGGGQGWTPVPVFFARAGYTPAALEYAAGQGVRALALDQMGFK